MAASIRAFCGIAIAVVAAACATAWAAPAILGAKPTYLEDVTHSFPNAEAVTPRMWAPGLDDGYTPQGLAVVGAYLLVSAYQDTDVQRPKCRVFRVEIATGTVAGSFDMPAPCTHAGGIADIGGGSIVVADSRQDWKVDLAKALAAGNADGASRGMIKIARGFGSAFTFFDGKDLWNGMYVTEAEASEAKIYRLDLALFDRPTPPTVKQGIPLEILQIPALAQGAAIDRDGNLWLAASSGPTVSYLYRLDRKTGKALARYGMPPRIENISFDADGRLWAISESGSRKYANGKNDFPFIFEIDPSKLK